MTDTDPTAFIRTAMPLCATLGVTARTLTAERVELNMVWTEALCTSNRILHGGALMALADSAGAAVAYLNLPDRTTRTSTIESKTNFLGAVTEGTVTATAIPLHVGTTTIVVETEIRHRDRLVAKVTQTQNVLNRNT
ncbi:PaaI family thioesterase [Ilumatobacter sp.]|uniref:PaaI family thioesterase n=1 Tax=Ilumatobacter sp. TaxID=1967498 RepID=UPI003C39E612